MKTARNAFLFLAVCLMALTLALRAQDNLVPPTATPAPPPPTLAAPIILGGVQPEVVQTTVMQWLGVLSVLITALAGFVAHVLAKVGEVKDRLNRQGDRTTQLQGQVVDLAKSMPGPPPTTTPAGTGGGTSTVITGALIIGLLLSGCATREPQPPLTPEQRAAELNERAAAREQWRAIGLATLGGIARAGTDFAVNRLESDRGFRK